MCGFIVCLYGFCLAVKVQWYSSVVQKPSLQTCEIRGTFLKRLIRNRWDMDATIMRTKRKTNAKLLISANTRGHTAEIRDQCEICATCERNPSKLHATHMRNNCEQMALQLAYSLMCVTFCHMSFVCSGKYMCMATSLPVWAEFLVYEL